MKIIVFILIGCFIVACGQKDTKNKVAERIQYDVSIKNTDPEAAWWVDNIIGPERERLVKSILSKAFNGEIQVYDYFNEPIDPADVKDIAVDTIYKTLLRTSPPYDEYDTMVVIKLTHEDITKIRFLEEWTFDEGTLEIQKRIIGIAPVKVVKMRGNEYTMPLFWIYLDEKYPAEL